MRSGERSFSRLQRSDVAIAVFVAIQGCANLTDKIVESGRGVAFGLNSNVVPYHISGIRFQFAPREIGLA